MTDFQRNKVALKYEEVIAEQMRVKQLSGLRKGNVSPLRPNEPNGEATSKRKELAKIAGTSEGSIWRSKMILEKGTPEQIERAEKGGKGNSMTGTVQRLLYHDGTPVENAEIADNEAVAGKPLNYRWQL